MRRFMGGAIWGAIVGVLGLGVVSQLAPVPKPAGVVADVVPAAKVAPEPEVAAEPKAEPAVAEVPAVAEAPAVAAAEAPAVATVAAAETTDEPPQPVVADAHAQATIPQGAESAAPVTADAAPVVADNAPVTQPEAETSPVVAQAPVQPPAAPPSDAPASQTAPEVAETPDAPAAEAPVATAVLATPTSPGTDTTPAIAELPPPPPLTAEEQALLDAAVAGAMPLEPVENPIVPMPEVAPAPMAVADAKPAAEPAPDAAVLAPEPAFEPAGVITDNTPSTLAPTPPLVSAGTVIADDVADVATEAVVLDADAPPLTRFAAAFENPEAKPLFSIVLFDQGTADLDRVTFADLPFPVSFVVDPLAPGAAEAAALYRAGGKEVLMLASGIPDGATPADLEQTFQAHAAALPEAVAVIDQAEAGFQNDRALSTQLVPILAAQGRGLLTWDRGLNAADQVARREALPTAMVFRSLDAEGEDTPVIRRYLDRAAFKAAQEGAVTVVGQARPETVAALLEWAVEGRAATVALAPVSAVLAGQ